MTASCHERCDSRYFSQYARVSVIADEAKGFRATGAGHPFRHHGQIHAAGFPWISRSWGPVFSFRFFFFF